jgi:hypothetical protein
MQVRDTRYELLVKKLGVEELCFVGIAGLNCVPSGLLVVETRKIKNCGSWNSWT